MNKNILIFIMFLVSSCSITKNSKKETKILNHNLPQNTKELISQVNNHLINPESISLIAKINFKIGSKTQSLNANIHLIKDSLIWVSLRTSLGIEVVRSVITKDSISYINRIEKNYFIKPISYFKETLNINRGYYLLEEILLSSPKILDQNDYQWNELKDNHSSYILPYILYSENNLYVINSQTFNIEYFSLIESKNPRREIKVHFQSFALKDGYRYPMKIGVDLATDELFVVEILYKKVDFNKKSSISFKIPKSYERTD